MTEQEATQATREHFAALYRQCLENALSRADRVNDLAKYVEWREVGIAAALAGDYDNGFTFRQYRHYLLTGECVALLPR